MVERLKNRIAIITGSGQGIMATATARCFAAEGARVVVAEVNPETGPAISAELVAKGAQTVFVSTDVTGPAFGGSDGAEDSTPCRNARYPGQQCRHQRVSRSRCRQPTRNAPAACRSISTAVWNCCRAVLPAMLEAGRGAIVNIASTHSFKIIPLLSLPRRQARGSGADARAGDRVPAARGIRVNAIGPGYIETPIAINHWNTFPDPEAEKRRAYDLHPPKRRATGGGGVDRHGVPGVGRERPFINAETIVIDGGRSVLYPLT